MPHHKACIKHLRQSNKERVRNNAVKTSLRKTIKESRTKLEAGEMLNLPDLYSSIDKVAGKGAIHKRKAARLKSRLAKASRKKEKPA